jgi:hypothetical protein
MPDIKKPPAGGFKMMVCAELVVRCTRHFLSSHKKTSLDEFKMVGRAGFEPATNWLKANCSTN